MLPTLEQYGAVTRSELINILGVIDALDLSIRILAQRIDDLDRRLAPVEQTYYSVESGGFLSFDPPRYR